MSAFEVSNTHIDALVSAALYLSGDSRGMRWYYGVNGQLNPDGTLRGAYEDYRAEQDRMSREVTFENAGTWGATLLAENRRSVNHRYEEDEIEAPYLFTQIAGPFSAVAVLKAISCYEYQACEHPGWRASEARAFCEELRLEYIRWLPGYGEAAWEIDSAGEIRTGRKYRDAA